jgi:hypothetical protein
MAMSKIEDMNIVYVDNEDGDWEGWYLNGKLIDEGHRVDTCQLLKQLGFNIVRREMTYEQMEELGCRFPESLEDVPDE